ncbi:MAG: phosphopantothenoylcysteine decarboxylase [Phycisphaeraceae bacterium]|nr:phosphopantothenoylcysteine decarboxylase [Phycisphaeraceae bacterium]
MSRRMLITAGPTHEPIDRVRWIGNRSSGRVGRAVAEAAADAGWAVTLLAGPGMHVPDDPGVTVERFETHADLQRLLMAAWPEHDVLVMAAAVSDYRPANPIDGKQARGDTWTLELEATEDLVALAAGQRRPGQRVIAFALEAVDQLEARAREKLARKGVDAIVANPLNTIGDDQIEPVWMLADQSPLAPGLMTKADFGRWLVEQIGAQWPNEKEA